MISKREGIIKHGNRVNYKATRYHQQSCFAKPTFIFKTKVKTHTYCIAYIHYCSVTQSLKKKWAKETNRVRSVLYRHISRKRKLKTEKMIVLESKRMNLEERSETNYKLLAISELVLRV